MELSIIIPTYRRPDMLRRCLQCIEDQTILHHFLRTDSTDDARSPLEVIVVSDGPDPATNEMMMAMQWKFPVQYFAIPKSQQGVCRNRAVENARGKYCLLTGDDMMMTSDTCATHLRTHERITMGTNNREAAVLGYTTWDPTLEITPAMRWMERSGVQFGYQKIEKYASQYLPGEMQPWFTYTSHLSLPSKVLYQHPFREDVTLYGWEDIEWGTRLRDAGVRLYYEPAAQVFHRHSFTDNDVWRRSYLLGISAVQMQTRAPDLPLVPCGWKRAAYRLCSLVPTHRGRHCRAFLRGVKKAREGKVKSRTRG